LASGPDTAAPEIAPTGECVFLNKVD